MKRATLAVVPLLAALVVGGSALVMSPAACGCLSERMTLAHMAGMAHWERDSYVPTKLEAGLNKHMVGTTLKRELKHEPDWCRPVGADAIECFAPQERSWLLETGYLVRFTVSPSGEIQKAAVRKHWRPSA